MNNGGREAIVEKKIFLGCGILGWPKSEKISGRYGVIVLSENVGSGRPAKLENTDKLAGIAGTVMAEVLEARKTTYLGDLHRGLFPIKPEVGEEIVLGHGFLKGNAKTGVLELNSVESRIEYLFNPENLHRVYDQTVCLYFVID